MSISDILASGMPVQLELLTDLPESSDPLTWPRVPFADGSSFSAIPVVDLTGPGAVGRIEFSLVPKLAAPVTVSAFGIRFQGQTLFVGPCGPFYLTGGFPVLFRASFVVYPWAQ